MFNTLSYIGKKLNDSNIAWVVGAFILLNQFGFIDKPNVDIMQGFAVNHFWREHWKEICHQK